MTNGETVGGFSSQTEGSVLVTPSGKIVGSAFAGGKGTSGKEARASFEAEQRRKAEEEARLQAQELARIEKEQALREAEARKKEKIQSQREFFLRKRVSREIIRAERTESRTLAVSERQKIAERVSQTTGIPLPRSKPEPTQTQAIQSVAPPQDLQQEQRFRIGLSDAERGRPTSEVIRGRFREVGAGVVKGGVGIVEGSVNLFSQLGTAKIEPGQEFGTTGFKRKKFEVGGRLGEIARGPESTGTVLGQALVILPALAGGVKGSFSAGKGAGVKVRVAEAVSTFSPFKIRSGTFGPLESQANIKGLKFDTVSFKAQKGPVTVRSVVGRETQFEDTALFSKQIIRGSGDEAVGVAVTNVVAPKTTFRAGTFDEGVRVVSFQSGFRGQAGDPALVTSRQGLTQTASLGNLVGGRTEVVSSTRLSVGIDRRGVEAEFFGGSLTERSLVGGIAQGGERTFTRFASGPAFSQVRVRPGADIRRNIRVEEFNIRGVEVNLNAFVSGGLPRRISTGTGPSVTTQTSDLISGGLSSVQTPKSLSRPPTTPKSLTISPPKTQTITGRVTTIQQTTLRTQQIPRILTTTQTITRGLSASRSRTQLRTRTRQQQRFETAQTNIQVPRLRTGQRTRQAFRFGLITKQTFRTRGPPPFVPTRFRGVRGGRGTGLGIGRATRRRTKGGRGQFTVQIRRFGEFKTIGTTKTLERAVSIGKTRATEGLGATFRIRGAGTQGVKTPVGFRLPKGSTKIGGPLTFIERREFRLSRPGEKREIQKARTKSRRKK